MLLSPRSPPPLPSPLALMSSNILDITQGESVKLPEDPLTIESTAAARDNLMASPDLVISFVHP